jgi:hypothetical protein
MGCERKGKQFFSCQNYPGQGNETGYAITTSYPTGIPVFQSFLDLNSDSASARLSRASANPGSNRTAFCIPECNPRWLFCLQDINYPCFFKYNISWRTGWKYNGDQIEVISSIV